MPEINVFWNENNYLQKSTNINISILDENKIPIIFNFADKIGLEIIAKLLKENKNLKEEMKRTFKYFLKIIIYLFFLKYFFKSILFFLKYF